MKNLAAALRALAARGQYGQTRVPRNFHMSEGDYCTYYWSNAKWDHSFEQYNAMARLLARYKRFVHFVEEVLPAWRTVDHISYMDNSRDAVQVSRDGRERRVQVTAPHGDVCF